jgi:CDGSH iron-sulfur domain-containing protein 3
VGDLAPMSLLFIGEAFEYSLGAFEKSSRALQMSSEASMSDPVVAQKGPFAADVQAGRVYWWCACGRSQRQPFCDGSHKDTAFQPVEYRASETGTVWFCGCKRTGSKPLCDGTHNGLQN